MLFNFQLRSSELVTPWRQGEQFHMHWFGLTDGWYWLKVGNDELFRYTDAALALFGISSDKTLPYVDYQVVRLWEDIQEMLPDILDPIPESILQRVEPGRQGYEWWRQLTHKLYDDDRVPIDKYVEDAFDTATQWLSQRMLDTGYLQSGPRIWLWTQDDMLFISWFNDDCVIDNIPLWSTRSGKFAMPIQAFVSALYAFDQRLIQAMESRVNDIQANGYLPDVQIDRDQLIQEHRERSTSMTQTLAKARNRTPAPWHEIEAAMVTIENYTQP